MAGTAGGVERFVDDTALCTIAFLSVAHDAVDLKMSTLEFEAGIAVMIKSGGRPVCRGMTAFTSGYICRS